MANDHVLTRVAKNLAASAEDGAKRAAPKLLGPDGGPDAGRMQRGRFVQYVRDNWADPQFRSDLFARMVPATPNPYASALDGSDAEIPARNGVAAVESLLKEAFPAGWPPPAPSLPGAGQPAGGGFQPDPFMLGGAA